MLRYAWRSLRRMPVLAGVVAVSLGAGIGVNTAIVSWLQTVVFRPLPGVADAPGFDLIEPRTAIGTYPGVSWPAYLDIRERMGSMPGLLAFRMVPFNVGAGERLDRVYGLLVSDNYFQVLGLRPAAGRFFRPDESDAAAPATAIVSYDFWRSQLGGAPGAVGSLLRVNGTDTTIVGVAPRAFQGTVLGLGFDVWTPAALAPRLLAGSRELQDRGQRGYTVMGRRLAGASRARATTELAGILSDLARLHPGTDRGLTGDILPFWQSPRGPQRFFLTALALLEGAMLLVLLAVCGNMANLLLARAGARHRDVAIRQALGATRGRIARLVLGESVLLAVPGAVLGAALGAWGSSALRAVPLPGALPFRFQTAADGWTLAFAALLGLGCGLLFGAAPAWHLARLDPAEQLKSGLSGARGPLRGSLMGVQVALALVVLVIAALFSRGFARARTADPGFRTQGVLLGAYSLNGGPVDADRTRRVVSHLLATVRALPGVASAAIATSVPLDIHGLPSRTFTVEGRPPLSSDGDDVALTNTVTPGYFGTMGIRLLAGSDFADSGRPGRAAPGRRQ